MNEAVRTEMAERIAWHQKAVDHAESQVDNHELKAIAWQAVRDQAMDLVIAYEDALNFLDATVPA